MLLTVDVAALLDALGSGPNLSGALCVSHREVFDLALQLGHARRAGAAAVEICSACPALEPCGEWLAGLPPGERPNGVIAR
jgi:hypothetical protein